MVNFVRVGVLGLQGAYFAHAAMLKKLGVTPVIVKYAEDLQDIEGLIIPGGESTVNSRVFGFRLSLEDLNEFAESHPVFGTCAGLILMARSLDDPKVRQLEILDVRVRRNAYGRQTESFESTVSGYFDTPFPGVFIRAPRIESVGPDVRVLATLDSVPVYVENDRHMACSFHPELTEDPRVHEVFLEKIRMNNELSTSS